MSKEPVALLKEYLAKVNKGEKSAQEVLSAVGGWMKESGDSLKNKIEVEFRKYFPKYIPNAKFYKNIWTLF